MNQNLFDTVSVKASRLITRSYSTSFSLATSMFDKDTREAIYSIYGFVRMADEIVDSFHGHDKKYLLQKFENDYYDALSQGISTNLILNSFQLTVKKYAIPDQHVRNFLESMKADLSKSRYSSQAEMAEYVYGSADVVGLMCLRVFCAGNEELYHRLENSARKLGSAFQKVNFLRDLKYDAEDLGRLYFPELTRGNLDDSVKLDLIRDIENDFREAFTGIRMLPGRSKLSVLIAYYYYKSLLEKIKHTPAGSILNSRIRISNLRKIALLLKASFHYKLKLV